MSKPILPAGVQAGAEALERMLASMSEADILGIMERNELSLEALVEYILGPKENR